MEGTCPPRSAVAGALLATVGLGTALQDPAGIGQVATVGEFLARLAGVSGVAMTCLLVWRAWHLRELPVRAKDHSAGSGFVMAALGYVLISTQQFLPAGPLAHAAWPVTLGLSLCLIVCILLSMLPGHEPGGTVLTPSVVMPSTVLFLAGTRATVQGWPGMGLAVFALAVGGWFAALASAGAWRVADRHLPHALILAAPPSLAAVAALEWTQPVPWLAPSLVLLGTSFWVGALGLLIWRAGSVPLSGACWALVFPTAAQAHALHSVGGASGAPWMLALGTAQQWLATLAYLSLCLAFATRRRFLGEHGAVSGA
jgi:tellurite resistance protein TehA-like permease